MRKLLLISSIVLVLLSAVSFTVFASPVVDFSWTLSDLGQGCWGGGALDAGGAVSGSGSCVFNNGQVDLLLTPTSWSMPFPGFVDLCANATILKGGSGQSSMCLGPLPVTGGPVKITLPGNDGQTLIRITPVN